MIFRSISISREIPYSAEMEDGNGIPYFSEKEDGIPFFSRKRKTEFGFSAENEILRTGKTEFRGKRNSVETQDGNPRKLKTEFP